MTTHKVPSQSGKSRDPVEVARNRLTEALRSFFGQNEKGLKEAVDVSIKSIAGLITTRFVSGHNLGATVMTEAAASRNPETGEFLKAPRKI